MQKTIKCFAALCRKGTRFICWLLLACVLGAGVGVAGALFHHGIELATHLRLTFPWLLALLPAAGVATALLYRVCGAADDSGTNQIFACVRIGRRVPLRTAPLIFLSTILCHLAGGSAGREGAALQLGGSLAGWFGRVVHLDERDKRTIVLCGMSAGFTALFGTPLTASVFALEVISVGVMYYSAVVPCLLSSLAALMVSQALGLPATGWSVVDVPALSVLSTGQALVLGAACALLSVLFCKAVHAAPNLYRRLTQSAPLRGLMGGTLLLALTLLLGTQLYNGAGTQIIERSLAGQSAPWDFILKLLFTAITLGAGLRGGEIVPALSVGAAFGCALAPLIGLSPSFGAALCMAALFCGATNCPIASVFLSLELFGTEGLPLFALCCFVSYALSGYHSLYQEQRFICSKSRTEWFDHNAQ